MEEKLRELVQDAVECLEATDDPYKREKLSDGIAVGNELLEVFGAIRAIAIRKSFGDQDIDSILAALHPVAARYLGQVLAHFGLGGLFGGGNNGRSNGEHGPQSEN